jgi:hypothetical protein
VTAARPKDGAPGLDDELLQRSILRLNAHVLGFVLGTMGALAIFVATNWLVLKGGSRVGPHLALLGQYFIGYRVSFLGSLIGVLWAFASGYVVGMIVAWLYNRVVALRAR